MAIFAMSLPGLISCPTETPQSILFDGSGFQMGRIDATCVSAKMVDCHSFWDWTSE
jgi:hypothetical protein